MPLIILAVIATAFLAALIATAFATHAEPVGPAPRVSETW